MNCWEEGDFLIQTPKQIHYDVGAKADISMQCVLHVFRVTLSAFTNKPKGGMI